MDTVDVSQKLQEIDLISALSKAKKEVEPETGCCLYCEQPITSGKFCDIDCSQDYEWMKNRKASNI